MVRGSRRGFTLIETIAAIVVLAIAMPPMLWAIHDAHHQRVDPVLISRARWLATEKLEDIIADRHSASRGWAHLISGNYPDEASVSGFTNFSRTVALSETAADLASTGAGYMTATVAVTFNDGSGDSRTVSVSTVLTEYTP